MTKTETANLTAHARPDPPRRRRRPPDLVRCAVAAREGRRGAQDDRQGVADPGGSRTSHFNHTLALKSIDARRALHPAEPRQHRRAGQGRRGSPRARKAARHADADRRQLRLAAQAPARARGARTPVEALVTAGVEFVELMERLDFTDFKVSIKSTGRCRTRSPPTGCSADRIPVPAAPRHHRGRDRSGSGSLKVGRRPGARCSPTAVGDTIRISLSTFHAEEEVKVAWEILKALKPARGAGPVLIACPTCGRPCQFDMDTVVADIERRLGAVTRTRSRSPCWGCAVNGIGEASHADFGITGARNEGLIFSRAARRSRRSPQEQLGDRAVQGDRQVRPRRAGSTSTPPRRRPEPSGCRRIEEEKRRRSLTPEAARQAGGREGRARTDADAIDEAPLSGRRSPLQPRPELQRGLSRASRNARSRGLVASSSARR